MSRTATTRASWSATPRTRAPERARSTSAPRTTSDGVCLAHRAFRQLPFEGPIRMNSPVVEHLAKAGHLDRIFAGGEWVLPAGPARIAVIAPSTEEPVAQIAL